METEKELETTSGGLEEDLLTQLSQEETFDEAEFGGVDKAKKELANYGREADSVWRRAQALNLPDNNPIVSDIQDHLTLGRIDRAKQKLLKLEAAKANEIDRLAEEKAQRILQGDESPRGATPLHKTFTHEEIAAKVATGDMSIDEAIKAGYKFG